MPLIIRAIITGFGYKIGAELGRYVVERIGLKKPDAPEESRDESAKESDEMPEGLPTEPPSSDTGPRAA